MKRWILLTLFLAGCGPRRPAQYDRTVPTPPQPEEHLAAPGLVSPALPAKANPTQPVEEFPPESPKIPRVFDAVVSDTNARLEDAYFSYDRAELTEQALAALRHDAELLAPLLREFPAAKIVVEGHCDERGSGEYNLALGDRRASRAAEVLHQFAIPADRVSPISYGKERPQCVDAAETCWQKNRRAHLSIVQEHSR